MTGWDRLIEPTQEELIRAWIEHHLSDVHTALPARVQSYDAATQTADLVPLVRHPVAHGDGSVEHENLPVLPSVPVLWPRTADHFIAFALAPGDMVLVVFCEGAIGHWRAGSGDITDPGDLQRHSLSHGVAIPGLFHRGAKLTNAPAGSGTNGALQTGDPVLVIGSDGSGVRIAIKVGGSLDLTLAGTVVASFDATTGVWSFGGAGAKLVALAEYVDARLTSIREAFNAHTHAEMGGTTGVPNTLIGALASVAASKLKGL